MIPFIQNNTHYKTEAATNDAVDSDKSTADKGNMFGKDGFTFGDIIDIINPLQHIPIVSSIYRKITGDTIAPAMQIAGGALFGGPLGAAIAAAKTVIQSQFNNNNVDPDSSHTTPDAATTDAGTIANNTTKVLPAVISRDDYSATPLSSSTKNDLTRARQQSGGWWVHAANEQNQDHSPNLPQQANINRTKDAYADSGALKHRPVDRPVGWVVNAAYNNTKSYTDTASIRKTPANNVDVIIGFRT